MSDFWIEHAEPRIAPDEDLVQKLVEGRPGRTDLSDEEFVLNAGYLIIQNRVAPVLQDALGLSGEESQAEIFPLAITLARLGHVVTSDFMKLQEGLAND